MKKCFKKLRNIETNRKMLNLIEFFSKKKRKKNFFKKRKNTKIQNLKKGEGGGEAKGRTPPFKRLTCMRYVCPKDVKKGAFGMGQNNLLEEVGSET